MNKIYVIDFLNVFSDYRELKYKIMGINFHKIKYKTLYNDTVEFFQFFFTKYIVKQRMSRQDSFIFVMKKLCGYEKILNKILENFKEITIKFVIVKYKYSDNVINDNKDDFMCQYLLTLYKGNNSYLISNDLYRNKKEYLNLFLELERLECDIMTSNHVCETIFVINKKVVHDIAVLNVSNCSLSKKKLLEIISITV